MTETNELRLRPIKRALISVSDKTGIVEFARELTAFKVEILSTGGTAKALRDAGIAVRDVADITGFPEMMDGRIKTLHPRVHGALLALRDNPEHVAAMHEHGIEPIDMVVVNLYPFEQTIRREGVTREEAIEQIDIGGPAMIRSAAKNSQDVAVVVLPAQYGNILKELSSNNGSLSLKTRNLLAQEAFAQTSRYDAIVTTYLAGAFTQGPVEPSKAGGTDGIEIPHAPKSIVECKTLPTYATWTISKRLGLRYGENPHQAAALYTMGAGQGLANADLLSGKEMSFNNYVDADAAWQLICDFDETACAIIKHTNPAGVGLGATAAEAYRRALATDPISAFGGIVAFNHAVDLEAAQEVTKIFTEVVIAPDYEAGALESLQSKKSLRVIRMSAVKRAEELEFKQISGGMLVQTRDHHQLKREDLKVVTTRQPTEEEIEALLFAWIVCKHTKSNAIVYARANQTVGVGAGQMSRVDSVKIGAMRAQLPIAGSVLASDAFFPFRDGIDEAAKHGITAVIQPGGSVRDDEVIAAANEHGLAMVFTGIRHFKH
jgi:phosphoribosylaminoimidazolecarboxamide formyltransferase / IMP cyclohydrolase